MLVSLLKGGGFSYFLFSPGIPGEMIQFDLRIFFNHQPVDAPNSSAQTGCSCGPNGRKLAPRGRGKGGNVFVLGTGVAFCTSDMRSEAVGYY